MSFHFFHNKHIGAEIMRHIYMNKNFAKVHMCSEDYYWKRTHGVTIVECVFNYLQNVRLTEELYGI
jgi:hypothetical protein